MLKRVGECQRCGHCCKGVFLNFGMGHAANEKEREAAQDFLRWASFHEDVTVKWIDEDTAEVAYNSPCRHLIFVEDGKAGCAVYEDRPEICRNFPEGPTPHCPGFRFVEDTEEALEVSQKENENG